MDLDNKLARLASSPVPDLSAIEGGVLAVRARTELLQSRGTLAAAMVASLGIGIISGLQSPAPTEAPRAAFGPASSLTPVIALGLQ